MSADDVRGVLMLPMGTIMTSCMVLGLLFATRLPLLNQLQRLPVPIRNTVAGVVFLAGCWNVFWYALRHLTEFWGVAALVSGLLLLLTSVLIYDPRRLPAVVQRSRAAVLFMLLCCALLYGITIYRL